MFYSYRANIIHQRQLRKLLTSASSMVCKCQKRQKTLDWSRAMTIIELMYNLHEFFSTVFFWKCCTMSYSAWNCYIHTIKNHDFSINFCYFPPISSTINRSLNEKSNDIWFHCVHHEHKNMKLSLLFDNSSTITTI